MICFFPVAYPDELLYSQLSRYYVKSGYLAYTYAAEDLFQSKTVRPSMEFITPLTASAVEMVAKNMPMDTVIQGHTMFPYYGHFLHKERRQKAFQTLISMQRDYYNLLPLPKRKTDAERYLRYCSLCAEQDRETYGETYWHRVHQMVGMNVCAVHGCYLLDSPVMTHSKAPPMLKTAEESIPLFETTRIPHNDMEFRVAKYMEEVFQMEVDLDSDVSVGRFLHSRMANTPYCSVRGEQRNMRLLHADFTKYYRLLSGNWLTERWQLDKILTDDRTNFYEVCLLALFLNIPAGELVNRTLPEKNAQDIFDEEIHRLHKQGLNYMEISKRLSASYHIVKSIGEGRYRTYYKQTKTPIKCGAKAKDWAQIDDATLPLVRDALRHLHGDGNSRPRKISVPTIEKMLNLPEQRIKRYLPKCKAEIEQHKETQAQYWAREVVWAANQIINAGDTLKWIKISRRTNMRRKNFEVCLPFILDYADRQLVEQILLL